MNDAYRKSLGEVLSAKRREADLSKTSLGRVANADRMIIRRVENGSCNVTLDTLLKITCALGISLADVFVECEQKLRGTEYDAESAASPHASGATAKFFITRL